MWQITQKDLQECREKVEDKAQKDRHEFANKIQTEILRLDAKVDAKNTDTALLKQTATHMQSDITDLKRSQKDWFDKVTKAIENLETKFATKEEMKRNKEKIDWFTRFAWIVWWIIITAIMWWILKLIII